MSTVETHVLRLDGETMPLPWSPRYDIVVDGSDNFETRYAVADACAAEKTAAGASPPSAASTAR